MPHIILEYSKNIDHGLNVNPFFDKLHQILEAELPTQLSSCKSRCVINDIFYVGNGHPNNAYVHLTIKILPGRSDKNKEQLGEITIKLMGDFFQKYNSRLNLQLSVEIIDLPQHYYKMQYLSNEMLTSESPNLIE
ncbi:MAG: 5-carboxymethyl-2-hydroxymuconate Delta-isomerase [Legionellales bacterium]|nr:5-carboxymethyl-2-hydroxymuconate Delta-isomerase [Legionellales bacterium]